MICEAIEGVPKEKVIKNSKEVSKDMGTHDRLEEHLLGETEGSKNRQVDSRGKKDGRR